LVYDPAYVAGGGPALDPATPLGTAPVQTPVGHALPRALQDCMPDRWGRTLVQQQERVLAREQDRTPHTLGELDLLLRVRDDLRQGDLRLRLGDDGPWQAVDDRGVPALTELGELIELTRRAEQDEATAQELRRLARQGSSLGGARPKVHAREVSGRLAIAKLPSVSTDTWDVMAWEKVTLDLAEQAGVEVPDRQLLEIAGRNVLVVTRFDRVLVGGGVARIGYRSAMTMVEGADGEPGSYLDLVEVVEEHGDHVEEDLRQLWRRVALTVLVSNTDDHLRNHGFLQTAGGHWRLAPTFDVNPNPQAGEVPQLSTAIGEGSLDASVDELLEVADLFRMDRAAASQVLREVAEAVATWRRAAATAGLPPSAVEAMAPAFEHDRVERAAAGG
jgi:serine/threonine-protein kinase HipA